ncbi:MAG: ionic transporter y4hA, partial [Xanthobacteraceae bacterium]
MLASAETPIASIAFPVLAIAFIILAPFIGFTAGASTSPLAIALSAAMLVIMLGAIFAAVHHADVIAHRLGEPFGTLVLTLAVTIIE